MRTGPNSDSTYTDSWRNIIMHKSRARKEHNHGQQKWRNVGGFGKTAYIEMNVSNWGAARRRNGVMGRRVKGTAIPSNAPCICFPTTRTACRFKSRAR